MAYVSGHPYNHNHGSHSSGSSNYGTSDYQQGGSIGSGGYGNNQYGNLGHGGNLGHSGNLGYGSNLGHGHGGNLGHGQGSFGGGSRHQDQFEIGSQGGESDLSVTSGFSKTRVEGFDTGIQSVGGGSSGLQHSNHGVGLGSGLGGVRHHGGSIGNSGFGAQTNEQKGFAVEETSGYISVNKNQGGFQNNQRGSTIGSSGGYGSSRY